METAVAMVVSELRGVENEEVGGVPLCSVAVRLTMDVVWVTWLEL